MIPEWRAKDGKEDFDALSLDESRLFFGLHDGVLGDKEVFGDVDEKVGFGEIFEVVFRLHFL